MISSAIEAKGVGPLDLTRSVMSDVFEMAENLNSNEIDIKQSASYVMSVAERLPHFAERCIVEGTMFLPNDDIERDQESGQFSLDLDIDHKTTVAGIYKGLTTLRAGNGRGQIEPLVAHVVEDLEESVFFDRHGNRYNQADVHYFSIFSTEITPIEPQRCHSMEDLSGDRYIAAIDQLISNQRIGELKRLRELGEVIVKFSNSKSEKVRRLNHQRLSYINASEVLEEKIVESTQFIPGEIPNGAYLTAELRVVDTPRKPLRFIPGNLIILNSYQILRTGQAQFRNGGYPLKMSQKQVPYVRGVCEDFDGVAPLSAVTAFRRRKTSH